MSARASSVIAPADDRGPSASHAVDTLLILFATESGNARGVANSVGAYAASLDLPQRVVDLAEVAPADIASARSLLFVVATAGEGEAPDRAAGFLEALLADDAPRFHGTRFAVLALGDLAYPNFCGHGETLDARLAELGGNRMSELVRCDFDYAAEASTWIARTVPLFLGDAVHDGRAGPPTGAVRADMPAQGITLELPGTEYDAVVVARRELHGEGAERRSVQLTLELEHDAQFEPGDIVLITPENDPAVVADLLDAAGLSGDHDLAQEMLELDVTTVTAVHVGAWADRTHARDLQEIAADPVALDAYLGTHRLADLLRAAPARLAARELRALLRAQAPRSYSIASSPLLNPRQLDLLVAETSWQATPGRRIGVASGDLIGRRPVGARLRVRIKPNPGFRLPADPQTPIVMIGPGSGVAPFRGFLQQRRAAGAAGRSWLFFGHRQRATDFLYEEDWQAALNDGTLERIDLAFSRDQEQRVYVQHRILDRAAELVEWIADGAELYICGDRAMGLAVEQAIGHALDDAFPSGAHSLATLRRQNRLHKDTY